jgi:integrase/recombinase XerC
VLVLRHLEYLRQRGLADTTIYQRRRALLRLAEHLQRPPSEATPGELASWRASLTIGDDAIVAYVSHVREFYGWACAIGILEHNPALGLPVPKLARRIPRPIGDPDLLYALQTAPPRIRPWLVLAGWAGLRAKEIAYLLRVSVLDRATPPVLLIAENATKGRTERVVPMSDFVAAELAPVLPASGWVFRRLDGRPGPNQPWLVSHLSNRHLHACGIQETLHQLRHRFGTGTYQATHDLRVVQELMGHASPTTTAGYAAFSNPDAIAAVQALPAPGRLRSVSLTQKKNG